jgi:hypothetical protein
MFASTRERRPIAPVILAGQAKTPTGAARFAERVPKRWNQLRLPVKLAVPIFALLFLLFCSEAIARVYWWRAKGVASISNEAIWRTTYAEVGSSGIDDLSSDGDSAFNVLLLGGSVLHHSCGDIAPRLKDGLEQKLKRPVRIINFSYPGRTSVESRMKYARLGNRHFDLVFVYHGINDAYVNNCPPADFRTDYTHVRHIAQMKALERHDELEWFVLPYTLEYVAINLGDRWGLTRGSWEFEYGADLRTPRCLAANVEAIVETARAGRFSGAGHLCLSPPTEL